MATMMDEAPLFKSAAFEGNADTPIDIGMGDSLGKELECRTCGDTFTVEAGRKGRPPTQCDNCKGKKDSAPKAKPGAKSGIAKLEESLATQLIGIGTILAIFQPFDGIVISGNAPDTAAALAKLAERDPKVRKALERFVSSTSYGELAFVVLATVVPILANHGVVPAQMVMMGKVPDEAAAHFIPTLHARTPQESSNTDVPFGM